jgi:hypothetical protein
MFSEPIDVSSGRIASGVHRRRCVIEIDPVVFDGRDGASVGTRHCDPFSCAELLVSLGAPLSPANARARE